ncbi:hypothetical protein ADT25_13405 [Xanthomonas oryzae]|uniref:Uncharacterized protein n=1 Tax=Xanthomonas oryzae TaxID=347 RepID=A0AAP0ZL32_9XANT|nr:hypothetical protein ADT25_13405 [Xanthomonas oryzae]QBG85266.1 hypothetical protein EYR27_17285 [Xanthomonas oryzae]
MLCIGRSSAGKWARWREILRADPSRQGEAGVVGHRVRLQVEIDAGIALAGRHAPQPAQPIFRRGGMQ